MIFILKYWRYLAIGIAVIALAFLYRHQIENAKQQGVEETENRWRAAAIKEADEATKAVEKVKEQLDEERRANKKARDNAEQAERERQEQEAQNRANVIHDLESRYRKALVEDQSCAAWSKQLVSCPVR